MKTTLVVAALISFSASAFAADMDMSKMGPWTRPVVKKDEKGIDALYKAADDSMKKQDINAAAALHDFPVYMLTDNAKGEVMGSEWNKDKFIKEMGPFYAMPMPKDMKHELKKQVFFLSETLAIVIESHKQTMGKQTSAWQSQSTVEMKDGKWLFKTVAEAGWGPEATTAAK